jgi:DNA polymerase III delta prime subunit
VIADWNGLCLWSHFDDYALDTEVSQVYSGLMNRLPVLKDELAFLEKHLPELEARPDLVHLAASVKKQIDKIRQQIRDLQENK